MSTRAQNPGSTLALVKNSRSMGANNLLNKRNASEEDQSERYDDSDINERSNQASLRAEQNTMHREPTYSQDGRASNSYNAHSNNSPDDSIL